MVIIINSGGRKMKKKLVAAFILVAVMSLSVGVYAGGKLTKVTAYLNSGVTISVDGNRLQPVESDGSRIYPIVYNNRTYLPVRAISDALGAEVGYDGSGDGTITINPGKSDSVSKPVSTDNQVYTNSEYGFSFEYPKEWQKISIGNGIIVAFTASSTDPSNIYTVNLAVEKLPNQTNVKDYDKSAVSQISESLSGVNFVSKKELLIGGNDAISHEYTAAVGGTKMSFSSTYFIKNNMLYVITSGGTEAGFKESLHEVQNLFKSFTFK